MDKNEGKEKILSELGKLIEEARAGLFCTVDKEGKPQARWMNPVLLDRFPNMVYAVTSKNFRKVDQLDSSENACWMIQTKLLDKVIEINGQARVVDDVTLLRLVLKKLGSRLGVFWKVNDDETSLTVVETEIKEGTLFYPMKNEKYKASF